MGGPGTAGGALRLLRATVLALVVVATGTGFHVAAHGSTPGPWSLTGLAVAVATCVWPALGRELPRGRVVALVLVAQAVVHLLLTWTAPGYGPSSMTSPMTGSMTGPMTGPTAMSMSGPGTSAGAAMTLGHLGAAVLVGWWLAAGERATWALLEVAGRRLLPLPRPALRALGGPTDRPAAAPANAPALLLLAATVSRRGPPPAPLAS